MKCNVELCIYECDGKCTCDVIFDDEKDINMSESCRNYVPVDIPAAELKEYKRRSMEKYSKPPNEDEFDKFLKEAFKMCCEKDKNNI